MPRIKVFLTEDLTGEVLSRYARAIGDSDACWALRVLDGTVALRAVDNHRWRRGTVALMESGEAMLGRWAYALVRDQTREGAPQSSTEQALLAYGLEARLLPAAMAHVYLQHTISEFGVKTEDLQVRLVASDPYLRASLDRYGCGPDSVHVHKLPRSSPTLRVIRERVAASARLRRLALRCRDRLQRPSTASSGADVGGRKTAAAFILNQRYLDLFQPVLRELESRGWRVPVFYYNPLARASPGAIPFTDAASGAGSLVHESTGIPQWVLREELLEQSPVSREWLSIALNASWVTGRTLIMCHRFLLERWRPAEVISFGPESMSLALQAAAHSLGIPSLFMNHTFREPARSCWFLQATASTMAGQACVEANEWDLLGERRKGMVATGHPPYDELLKRCAGSSDRPRRLPGLAQPSDRPYLILTLAVWGSTLVWHSMQRKTLQMLAEALPHDAYLICKLHPSWEDRAMCEAALGAGLPGGAFRVVGEREYQTSDLLAACDVAVMHEQSMSLTDAVVMGRPAIAVAHPEFPRGSYSMNHPAWAFKDAWWLVTDSAGLREALVRLTRDEAARKALLRYRKAYIERFLVAADGQASSRVADLAEHLAAGNDPDSFTPVVGESLLADC